MRSQVAGRLDPTAVAGCTVVSGTNDSGTGVSPHASDCRARCAKTSADSTASEAGKGTQNASPIVVDAGAAQHVIALSAIRRLAAFNREDGVFAKRQVITSISW